MTICKFHQQGNCKFGNSCRFEHPDAGNNRTQTQNRFGAFASGSGSGTSGGLQEVFTKYNIATDTMVKDLTTEAPQWILSAYAPGRNAPEQLFGGHPREQSFEEMRLHFIMGKAAGNEQQAVLYQNAQQQMQNAVRNIEDAARFIVDAENKHPNRLDICREGSQGAPFGEFRVGRRPAGIASQPVQANPFSTGSNTSPFGGGATQPAPSAFGQPAALGQRPNPFGTPAFGQPAQPTSAFGQPSQSPPAFGQASQPPSTSAFGQASALGAKPNPFGAPAFGQSAQPSSSQPSGFGQPSQLGVQTNPFASGGAANQGSSSFATLGTANNVQAPAAANPFASSNPSQSNATSNPFASNASNQNNIVQPSPFSQASKPNPFASNNTTETQQASNPFAQTPQNQTNGAFGNSAPNPFSQAVSQNANSFGSSNQLQPAAAPAAGGGNPYPPGSTKQHPPLESYASNNMDGSLAVFKGKPVTYKDGKPGIRAFDGTWTRIWFPGGAPVYYKDTEIPTEAYDDQSKSQWAAFLQTGTFADGLMPWLPPPRAYTRWDF
ncbi:hypothetical protein ED733_008202 [Metarhizium rileyi]|uniref:C3H1-type domain-containing protein n=1 Tax=Metarhizium rileyi (strain RCEF 4871) TaxID=1649241 RepID=A0A5C6GKF5_METRR|nr:hypothetical protein ED733_008202 [Metarhizium rileyi]